ncbi:protein MODIFIER OF SNC1 1 [Lactuca sativa]|uniref:BAT2 N-terminal domain-containing protein n=1 Tax=Lactuca sativa TaxID=4236 RepID=A0A9R1XGK3_LACSA|nr:protein MODIFIER OF SNC1 1 [Lactuca sativa]XP_042757088.1 protein MODIFIER OF SNC1 1 [Lactuca sativa]KAJ0211854.1 hypothetical protein LSAT_V11C400187520 [Lactuca sativa]
MTSSMLAGERRWASARRGGMTVLGKVAVPKPLNLPSQKLENHGLDPNVEIVPKGSLSWGSRPSSSTSNPWGASAVSPNSDGNTVSPRHPTGRPSSGGGLSRPSTAGSERTHEPSANTWGPNSRPSSASGVLTSNQSTLTTSRPLSAETRPGSSHLSRFAEPTFDNSVAWGPNGTSDKLSIPSKGNDFSLSSGDFPTLGSEKDAKSSEPHDHESHVRPGSASGRTAPFKERNEMSQHDTKSGSVETWTREGPPHVEEHWQGEPHQYLNPNVPPQHFDAWRGPPMNAPGVWYRGPPPPGGPPYPPVPHGGYPMEPFPYYRPQMPPPLANSQQGPPPGPGPRGHHPRNGDFYRPQMPDAFIRPGMPIRPGFYPGPVPYEGYFGPPMGYNHNPNDRDNPFMGMPPGPPVYNMCPPQNPSELGDPHFRGGVRGPGNMYVPEQLDSVPPHEEPRGPYKVLRKRENERNADVDEGSWENQTTTNSLALEKNEQPQPRPSFHKSDTRRNEDMSSRRNTPAENNPPPSRVLGSQNYPSNSKASSESWGKRSEIVTPVSEVAQDVSANPKDASLIQKIEGLNAKVRGASDVASGNLKEEQKNRLVNNPNPKDNSTLTFGTISNTEDLAPPRDINLSKDNTSKSTTASASVVSRQPHHGARKGRPVNQDNDGWRKKSPIPGSENVVHVSAENSETKNTGDSLTPMVDPADGQAQRARMRELAKQRAIQLQKEEEERIREQKAKALAKLEELNRRTTLAADGTTQTAEASATATSVVEQEDVEGSSQKPKTGPDTDTSKVSSDLNTKGQSQAVVQVSNSKNSEQEAVVDAEKPESKTVPVPLSTTQQRKRNNKSSKNKPKVDDVIEGDVAKVSSDPTSHVEVVDSSKDAMQSNSQYNKGQQHSRRMPRNPQANNNNNRSADRFHGNDGVVWAPVRAHNKEDRGDEHSQSQSQSQRVVQDDVVVPAKTSVQTNLKSRRAEMERYVPKPVAKELAQQSSTPSSPMKGALEEDTSEELVAQPVVPVSSDNISKQNKVPMKSQQQGVSVKKNNNNNQKAVGVGVSQKSEVTGETNVMHDWDPSDGWFMPEYPPPTTNTTSTTSVVKDEGGGNKGKKPAPAAYNKSQSRSTVAVAVKNHQDEAEVITERPTSAKENRSTHWQPKPQAQAAAYKGQGGGGEEHHHGGEEGRRERKPRGGGVRIHSPNNNMEDEAPPFEQQQQPGFRKYGQNNRGGGGGRQHNSNNNANINRERPRQNLHYEYQPVGSNKLDGGAGAADGSGNAAGQRYKEKGSGQSRRGGGGGNFYGRQ